MTLMIILWLFEPSNNTYFETLAVPGEKSAALSEWGFSSESTSRPLPWRSTMWRRSRPALRGGTPEPERRARAEQHEGGGRVRSDGPFGSNASFGEMLIRQAGHHQRCSASRKTGSRTSTARLSPPRKRASAASEKTFSCFLPHGTRFCKKNMKNVSDGERGSRGRVSGWH